MSHTVVIVGGGFAGVQAALHLANDARVRVRLISDRPYFNYHAGVYRVLADGNANGVAFPLADIFRRTHVEVIVDPVTSVDPAAKTVATASGTTLSYDSLIVALGSEPSYFGISGMDKYSLPVITSDHALALREHLSTTFASLGSMSDANRDSSARIVVIGGGPTGVEVASESIALGQQLAVKNGADPSVVRVDIIEALPRVLPIMPEEVSGKVQERLSSLGVHVMTSTAVASVDVDTLTLKDGSTIKAKTIVWTAGLKANGLYARIPGVVADKRGRLEVDEYYCARGLKDVFVVGDGAVTQYSGMAQTAVHDASNVCKTIRSRLDGVEPVLHEPHKPAYAIPVGKNWAAVSVGPFKFYGFVGMLLRKAADLRYFSGILPWYKLPGLAFR